VHFTTTNIKLVVTLMVIDHDDINSVCGICIVLLLKNSAKSSGSLDVCGAVSTDSQFKQTVLKQFA